MTANALHLRTVQAVAAIRPERGADTPVYLATAPDVAGVTGKYYVRRKPIPSALQSYNEEQWQRLWAVCEQQVGTALARAPHAAN